MSVALAESPQPRETLLSQSEAEASVRQMLDQGQTFLAHDLAHGALRHYPDSVRLRQAAALALLRAGALTEAQALLEPLSAQPDEETLGLLGRVYKGLWKRSGTREDCRRARDAYLRGFLESHGPWTGINAATLSWIVGDREGAVRLAGQVLEAVAHAPPGDEADRYWSLATEGEALLLLGREPDAVARYAEAAALAGRRYASVAASRLQLHLLAAYGFPVPEALFRALRPPTVVVFVGHMLDRPDRAVPRFPPSLEAAVRRQIVGQLDALDARIGYSSAACGSDLLFVEAMQQRGAEVNILLPYASDDFVRASVAFGGPDWVRRFHAALERATSVKYVTEESVPGDDIVFGLMGRMLLGYASLAAAPLEAAPTLLAVWDGRPTPLPIGRGGIIAGTADAITGWPDPARRIIIHPTDSPVPPPAPSTPDAVSAGEADASAASWDTPVRRQIKTLLFADVIGYSRLQEERMPAFMFSFLQRVAVHLPQTPRFVNTWGDAIFALMDGASPLAEYALALQEVVCDTDWTEFGLPGGMSIRIGVHAGPVFEGTDPITGNINYYGSHVNRAARIEPVTVPGNVYASEQFAALLTAEQRTAEQEARIAGRDWHPAFACEYIGTLALAKDYGYQPTYHLRRVAPSALGHG